MSSETGWRRRIEIALGSGPVPADAGRGAGEGVRTRDHLANTRTLLSWMRLALTLVAVGYAVDKLGVVTARVQDVPPSTEGTDRTTALALVLSGGVLANLSFARFLLQRRVIDGPAMRSRVLLDVTLMGIAGVVGVVVLVFLLRTG